MGAAQRARSAQSGEGLFEIVDGGGGFGQIVYVEATDLVGVDTHVIDDGIEGAHWKNGGGQREGAW